MTDTPNPCRICGCERIGNELDYPTCGDCGCRWHICETANTTRRAAGIPSANANAVTGANPTWNPTPWQRQP